MRGEHWCGWAMSMSVRGPSPRARGAPQRVQPGQHDRGTIPACAGSTKQGTFRGNRRRDHPRVRGEHTTLLPAGRNVKGPSPRARGAPGQRDRHPEPGGTIPACAGSTRGAHLTDPLSEDHPRVRGEHKAAEAHALRRAGPSPRARGAREVLHAHAGDVGTIPACAGSTDGGRPGWGSSGDHPRARGARRRGRRRAGRRGTIPACAGSTSPRLGRRAASRDHPRVRGEHEMALKAAEAHALRRAGPSPRARGAHTSDLTGSPCKGTIPACAGSTSGTSGR